MGTRIDLPIVTAVAFASTVAVAAGPLRLQWGTVDTSGELAQTESASLKVAVAKKASGGRSTKAAVAPSRAAYIVQFKGVIAEEWRVWLESTTKVRSYVPENAFVVWATAAEMEAISSYEGVHWIGEWKKEYKTVSVGAASSLSSRGLLSKVSSDPARWMRVRSLLAGDDGAADLRARLESLGTMVRYAAPRLDGCTAVALLTDAQVDEVASWADVDWIEPRTRPRLRNDQAARGNMMNVVPAWKAINAGGLGLTGAGQIVAVADTGCDKGSVTDVHPDFAGRILAGYGWSTNRWGYASYSPSYSWADYNAHGTHCCGSVLGSGAKSGGQYRGMAYEALLVVQGMGYDLSGLDADYQAVLKQAYDNGVRIHSNSWGYGTAYAGMYRYEAVDADEYMWRNQDFLVLFAAGNDGKDANRDGVVDPGSVTPPSTAKNCISVGAAENYRSIPGRTWGKAWPDNYPVNPIKNDEIVQVTTPQGMAAFSSRGPTSDGRIKPDVVAPGTYIASVRGRLAQDEGWGILNADYLYEGGTSMATPLIAGAVALVRQWLVDSKGIANPSAALMKALLINGARDMTPGQYGTGSMQEVTARPDCSQGFGHINLFGSLSPGEGNFLSFVTNQFTATGNSFTTNIVVRRPGAGLYAITLVWQDYPGAEGAATALVNDLDLTVTSPSGIVYYPNNLGGPDHVNNVEFIEFAATETGKYEVRVNACNIAKITGVGFQPYALVMRGPRDVDGLVFVIASMWH